MTPLFIATCRNPAGWAGALALVLLLAAPAPARAFGPPGAPLVHNVNPHMLPTHGHGYRHGGDGPSITFGFGFYAPPPVRVYPVPVYPAPAYPPPAYYRSSAPSPHWLDRNARWARPNGYGGMDYQLYDGRSCRTWREPYGALAVSCN